MSIEIKSKNEILKMRLGGKIASRILEKLRKSIKAGITTQELDYLAQKLMIKAGARPSFKGYRGYPGAICVSLNDEVVHGLPGKRILKKGDLVGLDLGVYFQGYHTDTATTVGIGKISPKAQKLIWVTREALTQGIKACRPGAYLGEVQFAIQKTVEEAGFGVVRDLSGHGIGKNLQESPSIPNFGQPGTGPILKEGMTLALEPMVTAGNWQVKILDDGWTVVTVDGSLSAHFEHTIVVTETGVEVLTKK